MKSKIAKRIVTSLMCVSMMVGIAAVSNATSISNGSSDSNFASAYRKAGSSNGYTYYVNYIQYSGMPEGAHMSSGLTGRAKMGSYEDVAVCTINTNSSIGTYTLGYTGTHTYSVSNSTGKNVTITYTFTY